MDIKTWAENITKEIYLEYQNNYSFWRHGIKVFYSPVVANPPLIIISYQPGGTEKNFQEEEKTSFEKGDFQLQDFNSYSETDYVISRKIRNLFEFKGGLEILKASVVFPLIFFRAPMINEWRQEIPRQTRLKMEDFSFSKVTEIVQVLKPQRILVLGIETYNNIKDVFGSVKNEIVLHARANGVRMAIKAEVGGHQVFAIIHPSGARVNKTEWMLLRELFKNEISV